MTEQEMKELAKAAAHSAVIARYSVQSSFEASYAVNTFLEAYEYAMKMLKEKQQQAQNQSFQEFGSEENSNTAKFR